jgi:hypothetical protein
MSILGGNFKLNAGATVAGRRGRSLTPLHNGLGFGAEEIKAHAQEFARESQIRQEQKRRETSQTPWLHPLPGGSGQARPLHSQNLDYMGQVSASQSLEVVIDESPASQLLEASRFSLQNHSHVPFESGSDVSRRAAALALAFDATVSVCVYLLSSVTVYALTTTSLGVSLRSVAVAFVTSIAKMTFLDAMPHARVLWLSFGLQTVVLAAVGLFACQFFAVSVLGSTLGRFVAGIELSRSQRNLFCRVSMTLAEVLCAGGLFAVPFVLLTPKRMPLFAWIKLSSSP